MAKPPKTSALDALPPKRRAFVLELVGKAAGNATEAARSAGYAKPGEEGYRLLKNAQVAAALSELRSKRENAKIATAEELRQFWTSVQRGEIPPDGSAALRDRIKASELLGKSQAMFLDRVEHSGQPQTQIAIVVHTPEEQARVLELAKPGKGEER
jgi:phage terminase small subunit